MELVEANNNHLSKLAEFNRQLIQDEGHRNRMSLSQLKARMNTWLAGNYTAVLFMEKEALGYALWRNDEAFTYLRQFFIQPDYRRNGAGTEAFRLLESNYWQGKILRLDVLCGNTIAQRFWQSLGFQQYCVTMEKNS